jgi:glycosyltransferase involved in cell wall biosynthesis
MRTVILMSVYNGSRFLEQQIRSLLNQSYKDWTLFIRDDCSTDNSINIIKDFSRVDNRIKLVKDQLGNLGASASFSYLLEKYASDADYIFFCDQDDVWIDDKVEILLEKIIVVEKTYSSNYPILIFSDLSVINAEGKQICHSLWKYQDINPNRIKLNQLLVENCVTGCSIVINQKLRMISVPISQNAIMHDWWLTLFACLFGHIHHVESCLVNYRQHENNTLGAVKVDFLNLSRKLLNLLLGDAKLESQAVQRTQVQAKALAEACCGKIENNKLSCIQDYYGLKESDFFQKKIIILKHRFTRNNFLRSIYFLLFS